MKELFPLVHRYFACEQQTFWRWSEDASVVEWRHGPTIVFREELIQVLTALVPGGLPPFGAVLLLLAACRPDWRERSDGPGVLCGMLRGDDQLPLLEEVLRCLDLVSKSMPEAAQSQTGKALLVTLAFEKSGARYNLEDSRRLLRALESGELDEILCQSPDVAEYDLLPDLKRLRAGLGSVSLAEFKDRARTGLDAPPDEPDVDLPPPTQDLLTELAGDEDTEGFARLTRRIIAALRLPHRAGVPADDPGGGYADIGNRGDLDRLLLSELAQDDLTLAVRLANNEALYLHRESPPARPNEERVVFVDNTIRMWGIPRVLAMATALAVIHSSTDAPVVQVRQHEPQGFVPIDLKTKADVMKALELINPGTTCAPALQSSFLDGDLSPQADCILITHPKTLDDPAFLAAERALDMPFSLVATVDRDGGFRLYECTGAGRRVISEARLDVDGILAPTKHERERTLDGLPLFLRESPCPLLLPTDWLDASWAFDPTQGVLGIDKKRRLVLCPQRGRGGRVAGTALSSTATSVFPCFPKNIDGDFGVVSLENGMASYATYRRNSLQPCLTGEFRVGDAIGAEIHGDDVVLFRRTEAAAYARTDGRLIARQELSGEPYASPVGAICNGRLVAYSHAAFRLDPSTTVDLSEAHLAVRGATKTPYSLLKRLTSVVLCPELGLFVETSKQKHKLLDIEELRLVHQGDVLQAPRTARRFRFGKAKELARIGCAIRAAVVGERGTVFTDDRGLLHLVSRDLSLPEITIAMAIDKPFGAWASDGSVTGPDYFFDDSTRPTPPAEFAKVLRDVIHSLMP